MFPSILLLGLGKMGTALVAGWRRQGLASSYAIDPNGEHLPGVRCFPNSADVPHDFSPAAVILAVKPQIAETAVPALAKYVDGAVFLSIMAGRTLAYLTEMLGENAAIVRAMPNTPAAIGQGISVACAGSNVSLTQRRLCEDLLGAVGVVAWTKHEEDLDAVTAISGSGPAYVFLLAELLEKAACDEGLSPELARLLARHTVSGAGALLAVDMNDAKELRLAVTSPGGTTEQAVAVLLAEWPATVGRAIKAAATRSRELAAYARPGRLT